MNGPRITVCGNAQDGCGNTMNEGEVIVYGHAEDIIGLSARGGKIFIQEDFGYRADIQYEGVTRQKTSARYPQHCPGFSWRVYGWGHPGAPGPESR